MNDRIPDLNGLLDLVGRLDIQQFRSDLASLHREAEWARSQLHVAAGDRVVIPDGIPVDRDKSPGWWQYREALGPGATGTVRRLWLSNCDDVWVADVVLDREWTVSDMPSTGVVRYWHGSADSTPEGYEPPNDFDQIHYPKGRKSAFALRVEHLRRVPAESTKGNADE